MALDKVVASIREEGQQAANSRLDEARKEAAAILADAERQAGSLKAKRQAETASAAESLKLREIAAAELEAKKVRLNAQKEVLAKVREAVLDRIQKLPAERRLDHIRNLAAASSIKGGRLLVAERDADAARKAGLDVAGTVKAAGGVVVVSSDGATREDLTYETLIDDVWSKSLNSVAEALFGKSK